MAQEQLEDRPILEWVENKTLSLKPKKDKDGSYYYRDGLKYLLRVIEQNSPHYDLVLGLAYYACQNRLSRKQADKAEEILSYYEKKGII